MKMKIGKYVAVLSTVSFLASCAQPTSSEVLPGSSIRPAIHNAGGRGDYTELAIYFERTAEEIRVKANEQKKLL